MFLNLLQIKSAEKKYAIRGSFLKKTFDYASDLNNFQRAYLRSFPGLDVYRFYIHSSKHST